MADQGRWFKLWYEALSDPDLINLSIADFGRWAKFGVYLKAHGTDGSIRLTPPCRTLLVQLGLDTFDALLLCFSRFPNCQISRDDSSVTTSDDSVTVKWLNWRKYQIDSSAERQRRYRHRQAFGVTTKKRGEEKRREENKELVIMQNCNGSSDWPPEWNPIRDLLQTIPFLAEHRTWLEDLAWWITMDELFTSCPAPLDRLLREAAAYCESEGYVPQTKKAIRMKLKNCMEFSARKAEREDQERKHNP